MRAQTHTTGLRIPEVRLPIELSAAVQSLELDLREVWVREERDKEKEAAVLKNEADAYTEEFTKHEINMKKAQLEGVSVSRRQ